MAEIRISQITAKIYRKEDILAMTNKPVNPSFGEFGADTYSIWLHKGGARCNHKWERRTYASFRKNASIGAADSTQVSTNKARKYGYRVTNEPEVSVKPRDTRTKGYSPNNPNTRKYWQ